MIFCKGKLMKIIPKSQPWEATLADLRHQYATLTDDAGREAVQRKITSLEKAISLRDSLSAEKTPKGKVEFSL